MDTRPITRRRMAAGAGALVLAACGTAPASQQGAASTRPATLRVISWLNRQPSWEVYKNYVADPFMKEYPHLKVEMEYADNSGNPNPYWTKVQAYFASGDTPDVVEMSYAFFPEFVQQGLLEQLEPLVKRDKVNLAEFDKTIMGMGRWPVDTGPLYSWWTMMGVGTFYYNKSLFDKQGVPYPDDTWTWDKAVDVAKRFTKPGESWGLSIDSYDEGLMMSYGGNYLTKDGKASALDTPGSIQAHQLRYDIQQKLKLSPTSDELKAVGWSTGERFASNRIAMQLHGAHRIAVFREQIKDFQWDVAPSPKGPQGRAVLISGNPSHTISAKSKEKEAAWTFLKWMVTHQTGDGVISPGNLPGRKKAAEEWTQAQKKLGPPQHIDLVLEAAQKYGQRAVTGVRYEEWMNAYKAEWNNALGGKKSVEQSMRDAAAQVNRILKGG